MMVDIGLMWALFILKVAPAKPLFKPKFSAFLTRKCTFTMKPWQLVIKALFRRIF